MVGSPSSSTLVRSTGLRLAPPPRVNPLLRLTAKLRLASALKSAEPPADESLLPLYVEALQDAAIGAETRARVCRSIIYIDGAAGRYVESSVPLYIEAACAFPDDPRCVLFVLFLLHSGVIAPRGDLSFSQGVYAAALYFPSWEGGVYHTAFGLPSYADLSRELGLLYAADTSYIAPDRTAFVEKVYGTVLQTPDDAVRERYVPELAAYLARAYQIEGRDDAFARNVQEDSSRWHSAPVPGKARQWNEDPLDDPEVILRGGSGNPEDDLRIARRYIEEERDLDAAACALFARCVRYAKSRGNEPEVSYWTVKLAHALISVGRVDEDTRDILQTAAAIDPTDSLLELAYLYSYAKDAAHEQVSHDPDLAGRLENVVLTQAARFAPLAAQNRWGWAALERTLALAWGHRGRTDAYARSLYKQVVDTYPDDDLLVILYARALAQANITDSSAIGPYETVLEMGKANEPVRRALASAYAKAGAAADDNKRAQAIRLWEELYRSGKAEDPMIAEALADAYSREGRGGDVAVAVWGKTAKSDPKNGAVRLRLAREMREQGELTEATRMFKEAAKLLPDSFEAQYETGMWLRERSDNMGAIRYLKKAVALPSGTTHKDAHFALGEAFLGTGKREEALEVFEKILEEFDSDHSPTLLHMARLNLRYEEAGAKRAEQLYGKALALDSSNPEGYKRLALLQEEQGRFEEAEASWEQYLVLSPPDAESTRRIADLYLKRGDYVKAESALRQTVALGGGDKKLFGLLGEVIVQAQKQRAGDDSVAAGRGRETSAGTTPSKTRRIAPRSAAPLTTSDPAPPEAVKAAVSAPAPDSVMSARQRQTLITQSSLPPEPPAPAPDSPASQNLTRSVGAAAIKAALRNRAARLTQAASDTPESG
jgi:tetratricopeptide (TPR) repeat protein